MSQKGFAPREVFETILEWAVIPTFDLILVNSAGEVALFKRKIEPYKNVYALPGLRMYKGESISDTLTRIAKQEAGVSVDATKAKLLGQYVGKFKTEHKRQDISSCYVINIGNRKVSLNAEHFSHTTLISSVADIPNNTGAMYRHYLIEFFSKIT